MKYDNSESKNQVATIQHLHTGPSTRLKQLLLGYCLVLAAALLVGQAQAAAQLMISPTRVVFEGTERSKQVNLINNGSDVGRFRISFVRRKMLESGQIEAAEEGEPGMYSDDMVRFAPRQVTLQPGQSQTVRLMLRKKSGLEDGEYRSHLMFQSLPDSSSSNIEELASDNAKGVSVQLIPVVGITIPVIVRQGKLHSDASLSDFEIKQSNTVKGESSLALKINRTGNKSVYGDFRIHFTPKGGAPSLVGQVNGVAVYTPLNKRSFEIKLTPPEGLILSNGELHVTYLQPGKDEATGLLAEARLAVP